jgi:hypothetical protein
VLAAEAKIHRNPMGFSYPRFFAILPVFPGFLCNFLGFCLTMGTYLKPKWFKFEIVLLLRGLGSTTNGEMRL